MNQNQIKSFESSWDNNQNCVYFWYFEYFQKCDKKGIENDPDLTEEKLILSEKSHFL